MELVYAHLVIIKPMIFPVNVAILHVVHVLLIGRIVKLFVISEMLNVRHV